jgi:hypothetical protein
MANPHRGEVELKAGDKSYTLVYNINVLCEIEEANPGVNTMTDFAKLSNIRYLLLAGLTTHHPEIKKTDAGNIIQEAGFQVVKIAVAEALERGLGKKDKNENPQ